jgi:D-sedoheptulose 7-phosphate isomerase
MDYKKRYLHNVIKVCEELLSNNLIDKLIKVLSNVKKHRGRLFFVGVGGGAGNSTHAVCDFRKLCNMESYAISDNISEITARTNDEGWETVFSKWLAVSNINCTDCLFIFSVGGGSLEKNISVNIINAVQYAKLVGAVTIGIVGKSDGYVAQNADTCIVIECDPDLTTPITESFQAVIWHLLVTDPRLKTNSTKW